MAIDLNGKWKLEKNENYDEFLQAVNIGFLMRKAVLAQSPTVEITQKGDDFTIIRKSAVRTTETKFKMGEEYTTDNPMEGKKVTMMATWEDNKQVIKPVGNPDGVVITRELVDGKLVQTQTKGGVSGKQIFTKIEG